MNTTNKQVALVSVRSHITPPATEVTIRGDVDRVSINRPDSLATPVPRTKWHARLRLLNTLMFLVHAAAAGVVLGLSDSGVTEQLHRPTIITTVESSSEGDDVSWSIQPGLPEAFLQLDFALYTCAFFAITAVFHARAAFSHEVYVAELLHCRNFHRWFEYAISASIMATTIGYFCGIYDAFFLMALAALTATTMGYGLVAELHARPVDAYTWNVDIKTRLIPHILGYIPQAAAWLLIFWQFILNTRNTSMPTFVYWIVFGQLLVFWSFGLIQLVVLCRTPDAYVYGEFSYVVLSAVGKLLLGAQVFFNVLMTRA